MTSTVSAATRAFVYTHAHGAATGTVGAIAILLLIALLIFKEVTRAYGGRQARLGAGTANAMIVPLVLVSLVVLSLRLVTILHP